MKRDMDLVRVMLLQLEAWPLGLGDAVSMTPDDLQPALTGYDVATVGYHMDLIREAGFINDGGGSQPMIGFIYCGLTWDGHDFLDTVRDPEIWRRTKEGAAKAGSAGMKMLVPLGTAYAKQVAQERLGIHLG